MCIKQAVHTRVDESYLLKISFLIIDPYIKMLLFPSIFQSIFKKYADKPVTSGK